MSPTGHPEKSSARANVIRSTSDIVAHAFRTTSDRERLNITVPATH
jgi:hypothetical protein